MYIKCWCRYRSSSAAKWGRLERLRCHDRGRMDDQVRGGTVALAASEDAGCVRPDRIDADTRGVCSVETAE